MQNENLDDVRGAKLNKAVKYMARPREVQEADDGSITVVPPTSVRNEDGARTQQFHWNQMDV